MLTKVNNFFSLQFQESASPSAVSSVASSAAGDFLQQRSSAKRKLTDDDATSVIIGGGNGAGTLSVDGKGDVKKVGAGFEIIYQKQLIVVVSEKLKE